MKSLERLENLPTSVAESVKERCLRCRRRGLNEETRKKMVEKLRGSKR